MDIEEYLIHLIGEEELKDIRDEIARIIRQHDLEYSPTVCRQLLSYLSTTIDGEGDGCD